MANTRLPDGGSYESPRRSTGTASPRSTGTRPRRTGTRPTPPTTRPARAGRPPGRRRRGGLAKTLIYYSAGTQALGDAAPASQTLAKELLDRMWTLYRDDIGVAVPETRRDYNRFDDPVFVPPELQRRDAERRPDQQPRRRSSASAPTTASTPPGRRSRPIWTAGPPRPSRITASGPRSTSRWRTRSTDGSSLTADPEAADVPARTEAPWSARPSRRRCS